jgi:hypothetical protein
MRDNKTHIPRPFPPFPRPDMVESYGMGSYVESQEGSRKPEAAMSTAGAAGPTDCSTSFEIKLTRY